MRGNAGVSGSGAHFAIGSSNVASFVHVRSRISSVGLEQNSCAS